MKKTGKMQSNAASPTFGNSQSPHTAVISSGTLAAASGVSGTPHSMLGRVQPLNIGSPVEDIAAIPY